MTVIVSITLHYFLSALAALFFRSATMDNFTHLNYCYPGTSNAVRLHVSQQPQGSLHHVPVQSVQLAQDQAPPGDGYVRPGPSMITHASPSPGFAGHNLRPQQKPTLVSPQGAVHSDFKGHMKISYMDESADLSDQYIPSSNDKITCTDHRPLDDIFGNIRPSCGWSQATLNSPHPSQNVAPRGHPRHTSVLTYPLPTKPQLDGVVQIPLLAVDNQIRGTGCVVDFRCSDWGIGVQVEGMPSYADLASRTETHSTQGYQCRTSYMAMCRVSRVPINVCLTDWVLPICGSIYSCVL
jgi:hypothetical protein